LACNRFCNLILKSLHFNNSRKYCFYKNLTTICRYLRHTTFLSGPPIKWLYPKPLMNKYYINNSP
jgi:hypothetical protein